jgi:hypothetical protein
MRLSPRNGTAIAAMALLALGSASAALAATANQIKGASYSGEVAQKHVTVSFKVSSSGKQVTGLRTSNLPLYCQGGGPPVPVRFANATISKQGTFKSSGKYIIKEGPLKGQLGTTLKITGKFLAGGKETGTLKTTYAKTPSCSGSSSYSTTG